MTVDRIAPSKESHIVFHLARCVVSSSLFSASLVGVGFHLSYIAKYHSSDNIPVWRSAIPRSCFTFEPRDRCDAWTGNGGDGRGNWGQGN